MSGCQGGDTAIHVLVDVQSDVVGGASKVLLLEQVIEELAELCHCLVVQHTRQDSVPVAGIVAACTRPDG